SKICECRSLDALGQVPSACNLGKQLAVAYRRDQFHLHLRRISRAGNTFAQSVFIEYKLGQELRSVLGIVRQHILEFSAIGVDGTAVKNIQQRRIRVAAVHDALLCFVIKDNFDELLISFLLYVEAGRCTNDAAIENLEEFGHRQERFAKLRTMPILDDVW